MEIGREVGERSQNSADRQEEGRKKEGKKSRREEKRRKEGRQDKSKSRKTITITSKHSSVPDVSQSCKLKIFGVITCTIEAIK